MCDVDGCSFGTDPGRTYEKQHEVSVRHLMTHQVMETRRLAEAMEGVLRTLTGPPKRTEPFPMEVIDPRGSVERLAPELERCASCGFKQGGSMCVKMCGERVTA